VSEEPPIGPDEAQDEDLFAAEYALGVLDAAQRAAAEARAAADPAFAEAVLWWTIRFSPLLALVPEVEPSEALWLRIEAATARRSDPPIPPPPEPANDVAPRGLGVWRAWAVGASAVAAAAVLFIGLRFAAPGAGPSAILPSSAGGPTLVATLNLKESGAAAVTVAYDPVRSTIYAAPDAEFSIPKARAAELWLIPADGKPRALGVIDPAKPATMPMPPEFRTLARQKAQVALSIEPAGGSTTGAPTGPVIAGGAFVEI